MSLRSKIIKLAYAKPELQEVLLPLVSPETKEARTFKSPETLQEYLKKHPKSDRSKHTVEKPSRGKKEKPDSKQEPKKRKPLSDLSKQEGFDSLKKLSPEKQREVLQRAIEMGKPKKDQKPVKKDRSDEKGFSPLKGLTPEEQNKVIQRALKMAKSFSWT